MKLRIVSAPGRGEANPYIDLFYNALELYDIHLVGNLVFDTNWLKSHMDTFDAIHLHWPENIWRLYKWPLLEKMQQSGIPGCWRISRQIERSFSKKLEVSRLEWFKKNLFLLKGQGKKIIYTWHNVEPHEEVRDLDLRGNGLLAEMADLIIFHSNWAEEECRKGYNIKGKTALMSIGNYEGVYPHPRDRGTVLRELGLDPSLPVVGMLGAIRDYKGVDIAFEALEKLGGSVQLLCAGKPRTKLDLIELEKRTKKLDWIAFLPKRITDQEFSDFTNACEFLLLPYKRITGSGALLASLTLRRGVVASDLPFFRDVLTDSPLAGRLVEAGNPDALAAGIKDYLNIPAFKRNAAAHELGEKFSWEKVILPVVKCF